MRPLLVFSKWKNSWFLTLVTVFVVSVSVLRASYLPETDILFGARNGEEILNRGLIGPVADTWNLQTFGETWTPNSWLWNVLLYLFYHIFGTFGFFLITLLSNVAIYSLIVVIVRKLGLSHYIQFGVLFFSWVTLSQYLNGRANTVDVLLLLVFVALVLKIKNVFSFNNQLIWISVLALFTSILWVNLHLTAVIAVPLLPVLIYGLYNNYSIKKRFIGFALVMFSAILGLGVSPLGLDVLPKIGDVQNESKNFFIEWSPVFAEGRVDYPTLIALLIAVILVIYLLVKHQYLYSVFVLAFAYQSAMTIRITPYLIAVLIVGLSYVALNKPKKISVAMESLLTGLSVVIVLLVTIIGLLAGSKALFSPNSILPVNPTSLKYIPEDARLATTKEIGDTVILYRPDVLVSLDGRNDLMGKTRWISSNNILYTTDMAKFANWMKINKINTILIPDKTDEQFTVLLRNARSLGWDEKEYENTIIFTSHLSN